MTKVLITGGAGFIGSTLVRQLLDRGYKVTVFDNLSTGMWQNLPRHENLTLVGGDVRDFELVSAIVEGHPYVINLAAQAFIPLSYELPIQSAETNALGSLNVFKACLNSGVRRIIHVSSSEVYGSARYTPIDENHPVCPQSTYAVGKLAADLWAQTFHFEHALPVVILRPFNTFGPRESLPRFINEMIRQCIKEPLIRAGNLETSRDFTYVQDTVSAMVASLEIENLEGEIINIGAGKSHKMKDVLDIVREMTNSLEKRIEVDENRLRASDVKTLLADSAKARKLLQWKTSTTFEEGVKDTIEWYLTNGKMWTYELRGWRWSF
jgi:nucleoside-diphosphate-sugar epimerase